MNINKRSLGFYLLLLLILSFFLLKDLSAQPFDTAYTRKLQNAINTLRAANNVVGLSAAAYVPGQGLWTGTSGTTEPGVNVTPDMVYSIGSITKNFVAAAILQLAEADSLSVSDHLYQWLPHYNNIDSNITIKQLLNHTSGIYNFTDNPSFINAINGDLNRVWDPEESLPYVQAPYFAAGAGWHYSNTNFLLLWMIINKIMHRSMREEFHARFFTPFEMTGSFIEIQDTLTVPFVHNWVDLNGDGTLDDAFSIPMNSFYSSTIGAGGVISRPDNLIKWMRNLYGGHVISPSSLTQMTTFVSASISGANGYGLGTMRYFVGGKTCWGHGGNSFGHSSVAMYYPQDSVCIAINMNIDINTGPTGISFMNTVLTNRPVGVNNISTVTPASYNLYQNFPNPFNPETNIKFDITNPGLTKLTVYNLLGKEVQNIFEGRLQSGSYNVKWNASSYPSGVYYYRLETAGFSAVKKMLLVK